MLPLGGALAALLCLEALAWILLPSERIAVSVWNRHNPGITVSLPAGQYELLSRSVKHNLESLFLMEAHPRYLFRVSARGAAPADCHEGINAEGFRDPEDFSRKARSGTVVVLLGDSCFFGLGICDAKRTLAPALERKLAARGLPATVYNLAQPGYSTEQAKRLLAEWLPRLRPHVVVAGTGWNDLFPSSITDREVLALLGRPRSRLLAWLGSLNSGIPARTTSRVPPSQMRENISEIERLGEAGGARVIWLPLVRAPKAVDWLPDPSPYNEALGQRLDPARAPALGQRHFRDDGFHPNSDGVELTAEWISQRITEASR